MPGEIVWFSSRSHVRLSRGGKEKKHRGLRPLYMSRKHGLGAYVHQPAASGLHHPGRVHEHVHAVFAVHQGKAVHW
jgi:hypothetical protein